MDALTVLVSAVLLLPLPLRHLGSEVASPATLRTRCAAPPRSGELLCLSTNSLAREPRTGPFPLG